MSGIFVWRMIHDPIAPPEENDTIYQDKSYISVKKKFEMAEYLSNCYPKSCVLLDTFTLSSFMLKEDNPKQFYITSDYDFKDVLATPWEYKIDFIIVPNPEGIEKFNVINQKYLYLYN
ncbi:hypothetical protein [Bacillus thuringiensis]|uniref:hypothetical protein n=1 Tax=Bacillus thuringiensis TaxID=1428 RepID=UPI0026E47E07|nr:hypothetical protein [Bacillus thuringiensis]MDO6632230.1 hypothetical protein [Bacillus thuringiensis]